MYMTGVVPSCIDGWVKGNEKGTMVMSLLLWCQV